MRATLAQRFMFCLLLSVVFSGCGEDDQPEVETNPFAGTKVVVSIPAGLGLEQSWELALAEWTGRTGAELEIRSRNLADGETLIDAYGGSDHSAGDLIFFPITGTAELGDAGWLPVISEQTRNPQHLDWNDLFKGLRDSAGSRYGGPAVVPILAPVLVCYYREDLLTAANLSPPRTWDEYQRLAETVDQWGGGLPAIEPWGPDFRATMFLARAVPYVKHPDEYSTYFDIRSGEPQIDGPGFERALQASMQAVKSMPPEVLTYDAYDCRREFFAGRAAMAIAFETGYGNPPPVLTPGRRHDAQSLAPSQRPAEMAAGFVPLPGAAEVYHHSNQQWTPGRDDGVNYVTFTAFGGMCAAVPAASKGKQAAAAWNLFEFLTSAEFLGRTFPPATRSVCRTSQMSSPEMWLPDDLTAAEGGDYLGAVSRSLENKACVTELPFVGRERFRAALTEGLNSALEGNAEPASALKTIAESWREIAATIGVEKVRDSYRNSLGLRPLSSKDNLRQQLSKPLEND